MFSPENLTKHRLGSAKVDDQDVTPAPQVNFEERLKNNVAFKEIMLMSPSIPMGFDSNCTKINLNDLSTIIC